MDGLNSFYETDTGLYHLVSNESTAMIVDTPIHSFKDYHCKVIKHTSAVVFRFKQVPFSIKSKNESERKKRASRKNSLKAFLNSYRVQHSGSLYS